MGIELYQVESPADEQRRRVERIAWLEEMARIEHGMGHVNTADDFWREAKQLRQQEQSE